MIFPKVAFFLVFWSELGSQMYRDYAAIQAGFSFSFWLSTSATRSYADNFHWPKFPGPSFISKITEKQLKYLLSVLFQSHNFRQPNLRVITH